MLSFADNHSLLQRGCKVSGNHLPSLKQYCYFITPAELSQKGVL
jgi:hypothetical protein